MADWEIWVVIGVLCVATAATRSSFWLIGHRVSIPPRVQEMLRYAPACALAAIIGPDLLLEHPAQWQEVVDDPVLQKYNTRIIAEPWSAGGWYCLPMGEFPNSLTQPGANPDPSVDRAWTAALVLVILVMAFNLLARLISRVFSPKGGR